MGGVSTPHARSFINAVSCEIKEVISELVGRIFIVDSQQRQVVGTASGMIVPSQTNRGIYDRVLTCSHAMHTKDNNPNLEFYFVRKAALWMETGLPEAEDIRRHRATNDDLDVSDFINYLKEESGSRRNNDVRRINSFRSADRPRAELAHHTPRYHVHEDIGCGDLDMGGFDLSAVQPMPNVVVLDTRNFNYEDLHPATLYTYYAVGFPSYSYFSVDVGDSHRDDPETMTWENPLIRFLRFNPLVITSASSGKRRLSGDQNSTELVLRRMEDTHTTNPRSLRHGAPTMKGMSGGPIMRYNSTTKNVEVIDVVNGGSMDQNFMCTLW